MADGTVPVLRHHTTRKGGNGFTMRPLGMNLIVCVKPLEQQRTRPLSSEPDSVKYIKNF
jgi:hypothetical protein